MPNVSNGGNLVVSSYMNLLIILAAILSGISTTIVCILPIFSIETYGILGLLVDFGNSFNDTTKAFSIYDIAKALVDEAQFLNTIGSSMGFGFICAVLLVTVVLVPMIETGALAYLWFCPLTG